MLVPSSLAEAKTDRTILSIEYYKTPLLEPIGGFCFCFWWGEGEGRVMVVVVSYLQFTKKKLQNLPHSLECRNNS